MGCGCVRRRQPNTSETWAPERQGPAGLGRLSPLLTRGGNERDSAAPADAQETTVLEVGNFNSSSHSFQHREMVFVYIAEKETTPLVKTAAISLRLDESR